MNITVLKTKELAKDFVMVQTGKGKDTYRESLASGQKRLVIGIGEPKEMTRRKLVLLARQVIATAKANQFKKIAVSFPDFLFSHLGLSEGQVAEVLGAGFQMANYEFGALRTTPKEGWNFVEEVLILGRDTAQVRKGMEKGSMVGKAVNAARELANTPGGDMTLRHLAGSAQKAVQGTKATVTVLGVKEIRQLKMGGVLGVAQGSVEEPKFIIVEYKGGKRGEKLIVLVGKGVTFDSGGLNIKSEQGILEMRMDMSGGAAVIHAVVLAAKLGLKKNVIALVPAVENMPSGSSYRPGDVLKSMSGKTIEVLDTDAEGRVILADALTYADRYKPKLVVDVATLTGAAMVALGARASALFATDEKLVSQIQELGEESGEYVWPFPLWSEYEEEIKGTTGDWNNTGKSRYGGAITAAVFLKQFIGNYPWVHLDIAPRMTTIEGEHLAKGAAGAPVRLLIKIIERM